MGRREGGEEEGRWEGGKGEGEGEGKGGGGEGKGEGEGEGEKYISLHRITVQTLHTIVPI